MQLNCHICHTTMDTDMSLPMKHLYSTANMCDWWTASSAKQSKQKGIRGNPHWLNIICLTNEVIVQASQLFACHRYIILYSSLDVHI